MAAGEPAASVESHSSLSIADVVPASTRELRFGEAEMPGGRISVARELKSEPPGVPFSSGQMSRLDAALTLATRETGLSFSIYLGEFPGDETREAAETLHAALGAEASNTVLIAADPGRRRVEIVTGEDSHRKLSDRSCRLAVMSMVASFKEGDLYGGLLSGLRMLIDQIGRAPR